MGSASRPGSEQGFGLLLVVVVLALMGALSLGAFGVARREFRNASDLGYAAQAFEAAEAGLAAVESVAAGFAGAPILAARSGPTSTSPRVRFTTSVLRLNESVVLLTSVGERLDGAGEVLARRYLGVVGKLIPAVDSVPPSFVRLGSRAWAQLYQ